jgi:flagellar biosynthesis protein FliQ
LAWRVVKGFAMFWWDFLVGDTPELFVATLVVVALVALCRIVWQVNNLALVALPALCVLTLGISLNRARRNLKKQ